MSGADKRKCRQNKPSSVNDTVCISESTDERHTTVQNYPKHHGLKKFGIHYDKVIWAP